MKFLHVGGDMRKRFLHPVIWTDAATAAMTRDERLMFVGMISLQDDQQRLLATPRWLRGALYPNDSGVSESKVEQWRDLVCIHNVNVVLYRVGTIEYIWLAKADKYQKPDHPTLSQLPSHEKGKRVTPQELLAKHSPKDSRILREAIPA